MAERARVGEIDDEAGRRLLRIVRRGTGSVVTRRRRRAICNRYGGVRHLFAALDLT
ncbi:hypothetical protein [Streptomyces prasinus]|uniref:hypothetical protein n=1 Tax=Streptomyces prasinus TaxID=67345 RepID=UPI001F0B388A|nr:hypothetical protein [Streptomyces prasinus]